MDKGVVELIDSVDWHDSKLGKWGFAVPIALYGLLEQEENNQPEVRERFITEDIITLISSEGMITELTLATLPILLQLLKSDSIQHKYGVLSAIASIGFYGEIETQVQQQVYKLMIEEILLFRRYLSHEIPEYRNLAGAISSNFTLKQNPVAFWLCDRITVEDNYDIQINMFKHLRKILIYHTDLPDKEVSYQCEIILGDLLQSSNNVVQGKVAIILMILQGEKMKPEVREIITNYVRNPELLDEVDMRLTYHLHISITRLIRNLGLSATKLFPDTPDEIIRNYIMY